MKLRIRERALSATVVITAVVVVVLAVLQYRWSREVSDATGVRLADTLQLSMVNWHLDFLRNFSEVCLAIRIDPGTDPEADLNQYVGRLAEWRAVARYPDLVSNVFLLRPDNSASPRALRLNPSTRRFEADEWPSGFRGFDRELLQRSAHVAPSGDSIVRGPVDQPHSPIASQQFAETFLGGAVQGWRFEPSVPALLHPITYQRRASAERQPSDREAGDWIVIQLSDTVIRTKILPDLAYRYFQGIDGLDYQVAVVEGGAPRRAASAQRFGEPRRSSTERSRVIYSSDAGFGQQQVVDADGTMDIFGRTRNNAPGSPIEVFHKTSSTNRGPAAAAGLSWFPLLREMPEDDDWQLIVRHRRGGPLGAFVADMHRRDLAISFGALLLLVVSMAMLIVTSNRAQRLARLQMDFVTAVSHELRTPLTVIGSAADNITQGVVEGKEQLMQYGSVIGNQVTQLSGLVEQILLFAATNEGRQRFSLQPLAVREIVDATLASTAGLIRAAHFTVECEIEPDLPRVRGDLLALSQCLQNLVTNALKYGREQRWIGIRAVAVELGGGGKEIQISVSDRGIGIAAEDLPHIFEPFYRSPSVAAAQIHGTGLGLSLARRIMDAMRGQLTVASEPGRGSTFTLHLPRAEQVTASVESPNQAPNATPVLPRG